ncbi:MAG: MBL fold metallo-hydrolase [Chloroflexi bacterium]|nr:MBL fold metallo-hydrolase [Chloroflexota bacterium]
MVVKEVAENIYMIDDNLYSIPEFGSVYLINEEKKALIDTGPTPSANVVLEGIKEAGVSPGDIDYLIVTHIHLDHAGGAGFLIRNMPKAQAVVHHRGARHLIDPTRLVSSALAAQDRVDEGMVKQTEVVPIAAERVKSVYEGDTIKLGERQTLRIIDAPGHAPHELCVYESRDNGLFTGDAAGICVGDHKALIMVNAPPSFDLESSRATVRKLMELQASRIYYAHFDMATDAKQKLQWALDTLNLWDDIAGQALRYHRFNEAEERLMAQAYDTLEPIKEKWPLVYEYMAKHDAPMSIGGFLKYYRDKHGLTERRDSEGN